MDDIALIGKNIVELKEMASELFEASKQVSLSVNVAKIKLLSEKKEMIILNVHPNLMCRRI